MLRLSGSPSPPSGYSKAFETFVAGDEEDIVGLLAYALYKAHIREAIIGRRPVHQGADREPTKHEVAAFKGQAETLLSGFANSIVEQAKPQLVKAEFGSELEATKTEIINALRSRTNFWQAVWTNILAWLLSIAITVLIVLSGVPDWILRLAGPKGS